MGIVPLWVKGIIAAAIIGIVVAAFYSWRSSLIDQGYADAEAEYKPKVEKLKGRLVEWQESHQRWRDAYGNLKVRLDQQKDQIAAIDLNSKRELAKVRGQLDAARAGSTKARDEARADADKLIALKPPKEKCDALDAIVSTARGRVQ